jgi:N4-gp56 family major capsid protein
MAGQIWSGGWSTGTKGGYFANEHLSQKLRYAAQPLMKFRQFCNIEPGFGKSKGDLIIFDKISNLGSAGGTLAETSTMPETQFTILKGTLTVNEYGIAVPYTGKLEALSKFDIDNPITRTLRDGEAKVLDSAAGAQFQAVYAKYVCIGTASGTLTTNSTAGDTATCNLNDYHVKTCVDQLKKWNVPKYDGENYICVASVNALRGLRDDTKWTDAAKYGDPERLFAGEVGRYYGCRFIEETNLLSNALNSSYGEAVFFGADAVMEGVALPEEIRAKVATDYGRSKGVAWYALLGFKIIWSRAADGLRPTGI